jgi:hypothetical protein
MLHSHSPTGINLDLCTRYCVYVPGLPALRKSTLGVLLVDHELSWRHANDVDVELFIVHSIPFHFPTPWLANLLSRIKIWKQEMYYFRTSGGWIWK